MLKKAINRLKSFKQTTIIHETYPLTVGKPWLIVFIQGINVIKRILNKNVLPFKLYGKEKSLS